MAAEARREARRKRILENSSTRLQRILDSQSSSSTTSNESSLCTNIGTEDDSDEADETTSVTQLRALVHEPGEELNACTAPTPPVQQPVTNQPTANTLVPTRTPSVQHNTPVTKQPTANKPEPTGSPKNGDNSAGKWMRPLMNVLLALLLVFLNTRHTDNKLLQCFLGPWVALQMAMFSFSSLRQELSSSWMSILKVTLQLCGIPVHLSSVVHSLYTFLVLLLMDIPVFIFSTIGWVHILSIVAGIKFL